MIVAIPPKKAGISTEDVDYFNNLSYVLMKYLEEVAIPPKKAGISTRN